MNRFSEKAISTGKNPTIELIRSVGLAYLLTLIILVLLASILSLTEFPEGMMNSAVIVATLISIMFAGSIFARHVKTRGWISGSIAGVSYMLILYLVSSTAIGSFRSSQYLIAMVLAGIAAGALGGILGINLKR